MTGHGSHHSSASRAHSLIPGSSKKKGSSSASSRFSDTSSSSFKMENNTNRKMKFIIAMGIALPILAAIIGVAAWAVSAEAVLPGPKAQGFHSSQNDFHPYSRDLMPMIESRSDLEFGQDSVLQAEGSHPNPSRIDVDLLPDEAAPRGHMVTTEKDPLYIVHFVPTHKPKAQATPVPSNSAASENILNKILSASKGAKPGTPQFVVFAPVPGEEGNTKANEAGKESQVNHDRRGVNNYDYNPQDIQQDYGDDYDEVMVGAKGVKSNRPKSVSRAGDVLRLSATSNQESQKQLASKFHSTFHNASSGNVYSNLQHPVVPATNFDNEKSKQLYPPNSIPAPPQARYPQVPQQGYRPPQQKKLRPPPNQSYGAAPPPPPQLHPETNYAGAPERSGYVDPEPSPIGIKLNFGTGGGGLRGLLGGGYSPLGLVANILGPILPRPAVNLNGKVMFGVMLENGLKLGGPKKPQTYYG